LNTIADNISDWYTLKHNQWAKSRRTFIFIAYIAVGILVLVKIHFLLLYSLVELPVGIQNSEFYTLIVINWQQIYHFVGILFVWMTFDLIDYCKLPSDTLVAMSRESILQSVLRINARLVLIKTMPVVLPYFLIAVISVWPMPGENKAFLNHFSVVSLASVLLYLWIIIIGVYLISIRWMQLPAIVKTGVSGISVYAIVVFMRQIDSLLMNKSGNLNSTIEDSSVQFSILSVELTKSYILHFVFWILVLMLVYLVLNRKYSLHLLDD
jgi:hypothetical protein